MNEQELRQVIETLEKRVAELEVRAQAQPVTSEGRCHYEPLKIVSEAFDQETTVEELFPSVRVDQVFLLDAWSKKNGSQHPLIQALNGIAIGLLIHRHD